MADKGGDVVIPVAEYTKMQKVYNAVTSEERRAQDKEGIELFKGGSRAKGVMKIGAAHGLGDILAGGGIYALVTSDFFNKLEYVKKYWWLRPVLVLFAGWILYRKGSFLGGPILATGAALFVQAWRDEDAKPKKDDSKKESKGIDDDAGWPWERDRWRWEREDPRFEAAERRHWEREGERIAERVYPRAA
jgi:hypothetical protein